MTQITNRAGSDVNWASQRSVVEAGPRPSLEGGTLIARGGPTPQLHRGVYPPNIERRLYKGAPLTRPSTQYNNILPFRQGINGLRSQSQKRVKAWNNALPGSALQTNGTIVFIRSPSGLTSAVGFDPRVDVLNYAEATLRDKLVASFDGAEIIFPGTRYTRGDGIKFLQTIGDVVNGTPTQTNTVALDVAKAEYEAAVIQSANYQIAENRPTEVNGPAYDGLNIATLYDTQVPRPAKLLTPRPAPTSPNTFTDYGLVQASEIPTTPLNIKTPQQLARLPYTDKALLTAPKGSEAGNLADAFRDLSRKIRDNPKFAKEIRDYANNKDGSSNPSFTGDKRTHRDITDSVTGKDYRLSQGKNPGVVQITMNGTDKPGYVGHGTSIDKNGVPNFPGLNPTLRQPASPSAPRQPAPAPPPVTRIYEGNFQALRNSQVPIDKALASATKHITTLAKSGDTVKGTSTKFSTVLDLLSQGKNWKDANGEARNSLYMTNPDTGLKYEVTGVTGVTGVAGKRGIVQVTSDPDGRSPIALRVKVKDGGELDFDVPSAPRQSVSPSAPAKVLPATPAQKDAAVGQDFGVTGTGTLAKATREQLVLRVEHKARKTKQSFELQLEALNLPGQENYKTFTLINALTSARIKENGISPTAAEHYKAILRGKAAQLPVQDKLPFVQKLLDWTKWNSFIKENPVPQTLTDGAGGRNPPNGNAVATGQSPQPPTIAQQPERKPQTQQKKPEQREPEILEDDTNEPVRGCTYQAYVDRAATNGPQPHSQIGVIVTPYINGQVSQTAHAFSTYTQSIASRLTNPNVPLKDGTTALLNETISSFSRQGGGQRDSQGPSRIIHNVYFFPALSTAFKKQDVLGTNPSGLPEIRRDQIDFTDHRDGFAVNHQSTSVFYGRCIFGNPDGSITTLDATPIGKNRLDISGTRAKDRDARIEVLHHDLSRQQ
jgi:hypothetical protein